jgi:hypothetical protein
MTEAKGTAFLVLTTRSLQNRVFLMDPANMTGRTPRLNREFPFGNKDFGFSKPHLPRYSRTVTFWISDGLEKMKYSRQGILWLLLSESSYNIPVR